MNQLNFIKKIIAIHKKSDLKKKFSKLLQLKKDHF